ncbi:hypothetical protein [Micromonospora sp. NPDC005203]
MDGRVVSIAASELRGADLRDPRQVLDLPGLTEVTVITSAGEIFPLL